MQLRFEYGPIKRMLSFFNLAIIRLDRFAKLPIPVDAGLDLMLDVGANTGQFGAKLRKSGFAGTIVSFEPLYSAHQALIKRSKDDIKWIVRERMALGSESGITRISVSSNSVSSSLLPMVDTHLRAAPDSQYESSEIVCVETLDNAASIYLENFNRIGLKLDVQGFELQVLRGAQLLLNSIHFIQLEMSLIELYEGQSLYFELDQYLRSSGFKMWSIIPGFRDSNSGRLLQFDGLYVRE